MKKYICLVAVTVILFSVYLCVYLLPRNYEIVYNVDNFNIKEKYDKNNQYYYFELVKNDKRFEYSFSQEYSSKRKKINHIKEYKKENIYCIIPEIESYNKIPFCYENNILKDFRLINDEYLNSFNKIIDNNENTYKQIDITNYYNSNFAIWNYKGLFFLKKENNEEIKLFMKDTYIDELSVQVDNVLIIPNYNLKYYFNEFYLINMETGNVESIKFEYEISYDSYILGHKGKKLYLVDKKNKIEYEINIKNKKVKLIGDDNRNGKIYINKWESISINKLCNKEYSINDNIYNYYIEDDKLYLSYINGNNKMLIDDKKNIKIVLIQGDTVLYLIQDNLYGYNPRNGSSLLMRYNEWNFNYFNKVFIYNQK